MHPSHIRNRIHLSGRSFIIAIVLLVNAIQVSAQKERMNNAEHDDKPYYFGITLGFNAAQFKVSQSQYFTTYDTIMNISPLWRPGFQLGIMGNLRLSSFVDARTIPSFILREKALQFTLQNDSVMTNSFESILFSLPLELKFKSDRMTNFRFYVCAGGKIDYDFNANNKSRRENELIRVKPIDYGYNLGLGFEFYFPNFIFSPEIKISNGLGNSLDRNSDEPTNKAIDKLTTRMLIIGFHIEG
ncbi:MAG TPA: porin family protein [Chitinophagaceae bacterium]|nr:porin family protein [Chitinophagaceae bacterium]